MKGVFKFSFTHVLLLFSFLLTASLYAQSEFQVEFYKSKGELQKNDLYKKDFGRYKGFEIPANKGEAGSFVVYSPKFIPSLILTDGKGSIIKQTQARDKSTALLSTLFPANGNYVLFIVADSSARGEFDFQYGFASEKALSLPPDTDFKKGIAYLTEHSKAYFLFFENSVEGINSFYKLAGAADVNITREGAYNAVYYKGDELNAAQAVYSDLFSKLSSCFDSNWKRETSDWKTNGAVKEKYLQFKEKTSEEARIVKLSLFDFSKAKDQYRFSYGVSLIIAKEH